MEKKAGKVVQRFDANEQAAQRMKDLIEGKIPPPNPFVEFMLEKLRTTREVFDKLGSEIQRTRATLEQMEKRILVVQGEHNRYLEDIKTWDRKLDATGEPEVPVTPGAEKPESKTALAVVPPGGETSAEA